MFSETIGIRDTSLPNPTHSRQGSQHIRLRLRPAEILTATPLRLRLNRLTLTSRVFCCIEYYRFFLKHLTTIDTSAGALTEEIIKFHLVPDRVTCLKWRCI